MRQIDSKKGMTEFFEKNLPKVQNAEEIYAVLLNQGYPKSMINEGYNQALTNIQKRKEVVMKTEVSQPKMEIETFQPEKKKSFFGRIFRKN
ncbi:hypothetical protein COU58_01230 [Candidatus Pacearchaeota archaeon CG10_big_fil_rev_8_21_14_0_10_32_42]|nr:MAG: hypothetical protein COU58_01230 [Candidatus Pacearchaeota archaeon CG10_big_fil_rev_8_21_14_0_10_32_42]